MTNPEEVIAETCPEALKPCPFCGGEAKYDDFEAAHYGLDQPGVECETCDCRNFADSKAEAIQKWNSRHATLALLMAARKALDECCDLVSTPAGDALDAAIALAVG